jgi:hypothetical protein
MNTSTVKILRATSVRIEADKFFVLLDDGREIGVPYRWFPRLAAATPAQRNRWRLIGKGTGIHWEDVDEDLSVSALLHPSSEFVAGRQA